MSTTPDTRWTIAYRKPKANRFQRVSDLAVNWTDAMAWSRAAHTVHPELEVWVTPTAAAETNGYSCEEDKGNILTDTGKRVRIADTGSLAALGMEHADKRAGHAVTVEYPFADETGIATFWLPFHHVQQIDTMFPGMRTTANTSDHDHQVYVNDRSANGQYRARCSCGWTSPAYLARSTAELAKNAHTRPYVNPGHAVTIRSFEARTTNRHRAVCPCGWTSLSYATRIAAEHMGDEHARTATHNTH